MALQALSAVLGGTQSLHTNGFDEALGLPTEHAAKLALRTQQVIAFESGVTDTVDPLAGSYFVESLTNEVESAALAYIARIDALGGAVAAIEAGFMQDEIEKAAYDYAKAVESGDASRGRRQPFRRGGRERARGLPDRPGAAKGPGGSAAALGRHGTKPVSTPPSTRSARPPAAPRTCSCRCARP